MMMNLVHQVICVMNVGHSRFTSFGFIVSRPGNHWVSYALPSWLPVVSAGKGAEQFTEILLES